MSDKINIDRLLQEKFKDFEVAPKEHVWKNIELALKKEKNKNKKIIPFWLKLGGIAATLLLGFYGLNSKYNSKFSPQNSVVIDKSNKTPIETVSRKNSFETITDNSKEAKNNEDKINETVLKTNSISVQNSNSDSGFKNQKSSESLKDRINLNTYVVKNTNKSRLTESKNDVLNNNLSKNNNYNLTNKAIIAQNSVSKNKEVLSNKEYNETNNKGVLTNENAVAKEDFTFLNNQKNSAISEKTNDIKNQNPTNVVPNVLEEILKKKEEEKNKKLITKNKWLITSNVASVYYNSVSNGSPLDANFSENNKTYNNNLSYGLGVNYALNKKVSVRTGINKVTLGYKTNDVVFYASLGTDQNIQNVSNSNSGIVVNSRNNTVANSSLQSFERVIQGTNYGAINQKMGYYEVPLELSYSVLDKKFGINIIGGLSTFFLNENKVSVVSETTSVNLGKATNLQDIHFSTNVGLGFKYKFSKSFGASFEPMIKYQINTFSNDVGGFKPYFIGLYSGVNYKF